MQKSIIKRAGKIGLNALLINELEKKTYECPRGHKFTSTNPIIIAVEGDPDYNSGPICGYCYVDWFKVNLNAKEYST